MSAFSDCNGPGHCGGPSLPQIRTLEQLISEVGVLRQNLAALAMALNNHEASKVVSGQDKPHDAYNVIATVDAKVTGILARLPVDGTTLEDAISDRMAADKYQKKPATGTSFVTDSQLATKQDKPSTTGNRYVQATSALTGTLDQILQGYLKSGSSTLTAIQSTVNLIDRWLSEAGGVLSVGDRISGGGSMKVNQRLTVGEYAMIGSTLDFATWQSVTMAMESYGPSGHGGPSQLTLLAEVATIPSLQTTPAPSILKPATVFVSFGNTQGWSAIIDVTPGYDSTGTNGTPGSVSMQCSSNVPAGFTAMLVEGTVNSVKHLYVAIGCTTGSNLSGSISVACINAYAKGAANYTAPNGTTHLASSMSFSSGGPTFNAITVTKILDSAGHEVFNLTHNNIVIGNVNDGNHNIKFVVPYVSGSGLSRIQVEGAGGAGNTQLAYLSDLANLAGGMVWQQEVTITTDTLTTLQGLGTSFPTGPNTSVAFANGNIALVQGTSATAAAPTYYTYNNGSWGNATPVATPVRPTTTVDSIAYEWFGFHINALSPGYYAKGFIVGSYSFVNPVGWKIPFSSFDIDLSAYRTAAQQAVADSLNNQLALIQPDWAETRPTRYIDGQLYPNPAFINNKPNQGLTILDAGEVGSTNTVQWQYLVDGGDTDTIQNAIQNLYAHKTDAFENVIVRVLRYTAPNISSWVNDANLKYCILIHTATNNVYIVKDDGSLLLITNNVAPPITIPTPPSGAANTGSWVLSVDVDAAGVTGNLYWEKVTP